MSVCLYVCLLVCDNLLFTSQDNAYQVVTKANDVYMHYSNVN